MFATAQLHMTLPFLHALWGLFLLGAEELHRVLEATPDFDEGFRRLILDALIRRRFMIFM